MDRQTLKTGNEILENINREDGYLESIRRVLDDKDQRIFGTFRITGSGGFQIEIPSNVLVVVITTLKEEFERRKKHQEDLLKNL